jgi:hypothetical protein
MRWIVLLAALHLAACTQFDNGLVDTTRIKVGVTNKTEVEAMLGPPTQWSSSAKGTEEVWSYVRGNDDAVSAKASKIPIVGYAFEPFVNPTPGFVSITFLNNVVRSCKIVMDTDGRKTTSEDCGAL